MKKKVFNATIVCLITSAFQLMTLCLYSQAPPVLKGRVTDRTTREPLIGVTVVEVNELNRTLNGTVTDVSGNFALRLSTSEALVKISYVGYRTEEFTVSGADFLEVTLGEESRLLDEVSQQAVGGFMQRQPHTAVEGGHIMVSGNHDGFAIRIGLLTTGKLHHNF